MSARPTTVLAVDIGGTKTILQLARKNSDGTVERIAESLFDSQATRSFDEVLSIFLRQEKYTGVVDAACFGVAGPVDGDFAKVTNLPWQLDASSIAKSFNIDKVSLLNDFQVVGYGIDALGPEDLFVVQEGRPVSGGVRAIIGAGTGLGVGFMVASHDRYQVYPSEGGHVGFAPSNSTEIALLQFLQQTYAQVSYERVLSGPGLENIYRYFVSSRHQQFGQNISAADITRMASDGTDKCATLALQQFMKIYGAQSGNIALNFMATGGVYIAGGVAPRIKEFFLQDDFLVSFVQKSKMETLMKHFPIMIVNNPQVGLLGAREVAFHLAR